MDQTSAIRIEGILQGVRALLHYAASQAPLYTSEDEGDQIKRGIACAMFEISKISVLLYKQHAESLPVEMRPKGGETTEQLRDMIDLWESSMRKLGE